MDDLTGSWKLVSLQHKPAGGTEYYPLGKDPQGLLIYSRDGYMAIALSPRIRPYFQDSRLFMGTDTEKAVAFGTYVSYSGRYRISNDKVIHKIEMSLFPNWVGTEQERLFQFDVQNQLVISTPEYVSATGAMETASLVWTRP